MELRINRNVTSKSRMHSSSLPQAGAQLVQHFVSNSCFRLSSEPLQYPPPAASCRTLFASGGQRSGTITAKQEKQERIDYGTWKMNKKEENA